MLITPNLQNKTIKHIFFVIFYLKTKNIYLIMLFIDFLIKETGAINYASSGWIAII
jgi:hypothetical protein